MSAAHSASFPDPLTSAEEDAAKPRLWGPPHPSPWAVQRPSFLELSRALRPSSTVRLGGDETGDHLVLVLSIL